MESSFGFRPSWPDEVKELWHNWRREALRVESLENYAKHCAPDEFEATVDELEKATAKVMEYAKALMNADRKYAAEHYPWCNASHSVNPHTRARGEDLDGLE
jgi:hypothetical protein